jgi:tripartite-type tricarboxylate transporter receptor subunit TctC
LKNRIAALLLGLTAALVPLATQAQTFPNKPIRLVVPFPAGSATDSIGRTLGAAVSVALGQQVIVDNKAGADGAIAAAEVARAAPDGYTLLMATNSPMSAVPALRKVPPYDPVADFTPITDAGRYTFFIVVHPSVPANSIAELIQYAKANPGKLNYATGNTTGIVSTALFASLAGIQMVHVPYKGEPQAMTDLIGGRVQFLVATAATVAPHVREGRLRALAVTLEQRSPARRAHHRRGGHAQVQAHVLGRCVWPGQDATRHRPAAEPRVRGRHRPARGAGRHGQAGLHADWHLAREADRPGARAARQLQEHAQDSGYRARVTRGCALRRSAVKL